MAIKPNDEYPAQTTAPDANYPYGGAKNDALPDDGTGTPLEQAWMNDWFGFSQFWLAAAGIEPSGNPETAQVSQISQAIGQTVGFLATPVGYLAPPLFVDDTSLYPPDDSDSFRYVLLTAGESEVGGYNEGILTGESVTGSGDLVQATAQINLPASPLHGQTIRLINTERSFVRPGEQADVFQLDQMQRITGEIDGSAGLATAPVGFLAPGTGTGALAGAENKSNRGQGDTGVSGGMDQRLILDSANSPDSRTSSTTAGETRPKNVSAVYFLRVL